MSNVIGQLGKVVADTWSKPAGIGETSKTPTEVKTSEGQNTSQTENVKTSFSKALSWIGENKFRAAAGISSGVLLLAAGIPGALIGGATYIEGKIKSVFDPKSEEPPRQASKELKAYRDFGASVSKYSNELREMQKEGKTEQNMDFQLVKTQLKEAQKWSLHMYTQLSSEDKKEAAKGQEFKSGSDYRKDARWWSAPLLAGVNCLSYAFGSDKRV